jgi:hypothetical protein
MWNKIIAVLIGILIAGVAAVWVPKMNAQEASDWTKDLVKDHCGDDFFDDPEGINVCKGFNPENAAKIVGVLCLQF